MALHFLSFKTEEILRCIESIPHASQKIRKELEGFVGVILREGLDFKLGRKLSGWLRTTVLANMPAYLPEVSLYKNHLEITINHFDMLLEAMFKHYDKPTFVDGSILQQWQLGAQNMFISLSSQMQQVPTRQADEASRVSLVSQRLSLLRE